MLASNFILATAEECLIKLVRARQVGRRRLVRSKSVGSQIRARLSARKPASVVWRPFPFAVAVKPTAQYLCLGTDVSHGVVEAHPPSAISADDPGKRFDGGKGKKN